MKVKDQLHTEERDRYCNGRPVECASGDQAIPASGKGEPLAGDIDDFRR